MKNTITASLLKAKGWQTAVEIALSVGLRSPSNVTVVLRQLHDDGLVLSRDGKDPFGKPVEQWRHVSLANPAPKPRKAGGILDEKLIAGLRDAKARALAEITKIDERLARTGVTE